MKSTRLALPLSLVLLAACAEVPPPATPRPAGPSVAAQITEAALPALLALLAIGLAAGGTSGAGAGGGPGGPGL